MLAAPLCLILLITAVLGQRSFLEFQIRKRHTNGDKPSLIGKLTINIHPNHIAEPTDDTQKLLAEAYVDTHLAELVSQQDFASGHQAILEFTCVDTDLPHYKDRVYLTAVDELILEPHGQKIAVILGPSKQAISINSINYVQTRDRAGQIYTQILHTLPLEDRLYRYEQQKSKAAQAQQQSFISKYKWPLIIGGVVLYTMMTASPDKAAGGAGGAAGGR